MARRLGPSNALKGLSQTNQIGAKAVLRDVIQSSPVAEAAVAAACERHASGIARVRNGMLYSTGGFVTTAGGVIAAGTSFTLFNVPIGNADPNLGTITESDTNLTSQSRLTNEAFQSWGLGFKVFPFSDVATELAQDVAEMTEQIYKNCSIKLQLGAQDVQKLGTLDMWPAAGYFLQQSNIAANVGNNVGFQANGADVVQDYDLDIPNDTTVNITITCNRAITVANLATETFAVQARLYGWSKTAIQG